jgi:hypothetical protein
MEKFITSLILLLNTVIYSFKQKLRFLKTFLTPVAKKNNTPLRTHVMTQNLEPGLIFRGEVSLKVIICIATRAPTLVKSHFE